MLINHQLRWTGHVVRMSDPRLPKQELYSQLTEHQLSQDSRRKRYRNVLKTNIKSCLIEQQSEQSKWEKKNIRKGYNFKRTRKKLIREAY